MMKRFMCLFLIGLLYWTDAGAGRFAQSEGNGVTIRYEEGLEGAAKEEPASIPFIVAGR